MVGEERLELSVHGFGATVETAKTRMTAALFAIFIGDQTFNISHTQAVFQSCVEKEPRAVYTLFSRLMLF